MRFAIQLRRQGVSADPCGSGLRWHRRDIGGWFKGWIGSLRLRDSSRQRQKGTEQHAHQNPAQPGTVSDVISHDGLFHSLILKPGVLLDSDHHRFCVAQCDRFLYHNFRLTPDKSRNWRSEVVQHIDGNGVFFTRTRCAIPSSMGFPGTLSARSVSISIDVSSGTSSTPWHHHVYHGIEPGIHLRCAN